MARCNSKFKAVLCSHSSTIHLSSQHLTRLLDGSLTPLAMPKERAINPAAAQRKADKQKEINKNKKQLQAQRNEKLARRNPERLQRQIDDLKDLERSRGSLRPKDQETLAQLERDVKGIRRARDALGDAAPKFASHERAHGNGHAGQEQRERRQNLGKRRREDADDALESDGAETDPEVRSIPMPRDTPPPLPRARRQELAAADGPKGLDSLPPKPAAPEPKKTYSAAPQLRDLKKEAARFVPVAVAQKKRLAKGEGRLLEPEEIDSLEAAGYYSRPAAGQAGAGDQNSGQEAPLESRETEDLDAELQRFEREMAELNSMDRGGPKNVQMMEVADAGD